MEENKAKIDCSAFQKQESVIKDIINRINGAKGMQEKAGFAEEIEKKVDVLLSCPDYESQSSDCKNCHFISNLRKKTSNLIIKAKKLGGN
jgi:hypothetical protein